MKKSSGFEWIEIVQGILLILLGMFSFVRPRSILTGVVAAYGIIAVITGITDIVLYIRGNRYTGFASSIALAAGVLSVMSGFMILVYPSAGKRILSVLFPIWFIAHCTSGLLRLNIIRFKTEKFSYYFTLIVNIAGLLLGFLMLVNPYFSLLSTGYIIGAYLILLGINSIVTAYDKMQGKNK